MKSYEYSTTKDYLEIDPDHAILANLRQRIKADKDDKSVKDLVRLHFGVKFGIVINEDTDDVADNMPPIEEDEDTIAIEKDEDDDSHNLLNGDDQAKLKCPGLSTTSPLLFIVTTTNLSVGSKQPQM